MGVSYTSISVFHVPRDDIIEAMRTARRDAYVSFTQGNATVVFDKACDDGGVPALDALSCELTQRLACPAVSSLVRDEKVLLMSLFDKGEMLGRYLWVKYTWRQPLPELQGLLSSEAFADVFCRRFPSPETVQQLAAGLKAKETRQTERRAWASSVHGALSLGMGLGPCTEGYYYLSGGDARWFGAEPDSLTKVGGDPPPGERR